ncbi:MAG: hypothetical protein PHG16_12225 [Lachnospiraceae bacterium]|nr:hypothetical protein [Lachnospiraceae bacterium]
MNVLVELKEKLKHIYGEYGLYLTPILKFLLALFLLLQINHIVGYLSILNNIFIVLILALICAILPLNGTALICSIAIVGQLFGLGIEIGAVAAAIFLLLYLLYFRFTPKDTLALVLTPVACACGMPAAVAIGYGLVGGAFSALSVSCGVFVFYFLQVAATVVAPLKAEGSADMAASLQALMSGLSSNKEMILIILASAAVVIIVALIRNMDADNIWNIAIVVGMICYMVIVIGGSIVLGSSTSIILVIVGTFASGLAAFILEFFLFQVDYKKSEYLQFQDDEYVYFVKAVPKVAVKKRTHHETVSRSAQQRNPQQQSEREQIKQQQSEQKQGVQKQSEQKQREEQQVIQEQPVEQKVEPWPQIKPQESATQDEGQTDLDLEQALAESLKELHIDEEKGNNQ